MKDELNELICMIFIMSLFIYSFLILRNESEETVQEDGCT